MPPATSAASLVTGGGRGVAQLRRRCARLFAQAGVSDPAASAKYLLAHCIGERTLTPRHNNLELSNSQRAQLLDLCHRRLQREPLQYILGEWDFRDINLTMRAPVFIPRPETEKLVDLALACAVDAAAAAARSSACRSRRRLLFCEVGTGSGAITACLLRDLPHSHCLAIELLPEACRLTAENCSRLGLTDRLHLVNASLATAPSQLLGATPPLRMIVSNPPYVPAVDMARLQPEVAAESPLALSGGDGDGLAVITQLMEFADVRLEPSGWLLFEMDSSHGGHFRDRCRSYGSLRLVSVEKDFAGRDRFCIFRKLSR